MGLAPLPRRARARPRRHGHGLSRARSQARPPGRAQGAPPRAGRHARPDGSSAEIRSPPGCSIRTSSPCSTRARRRAALVHHAVRRGREPARAADARGAAPGRGRAPHHARGGARRSTTPTGTAWFTATSSRRTSSSPATATRWSPTSGSRGRSQRGRTRADPDRALVGTPAYMSPGAGERERGRRAERLYSLGCVLYEMLAGEPPFTGPTAQAIIARRFSEPPGRSGGAGDRAAEPWNRRCCKALARAPADRFATAAEFARALGAATGATTPGWGHRHAGDRTRSTRPRRRLRVVFAGIAAAVLGLAGFSCGVARLTALRMLPP